MEFSDIKSVYFIGIGGIGMSAIARYFLHRGLTVGGYDRTPSDLTRQLEAEGARIHYEESVGQIPEACKDKAGCLVVYTPAIPEEHAELAYFRAGGFEVEKRAQVLGTLTRAHKGLCVAGTHGKTTTSAMAAHLLHQSHVDCNAFLGGISKNYGSNYILSENKAVPYLGVEGRTVSPEMSLESMPAGVYVTDVAQDSPAYAAGLKRGDIITGLNDVVVSDLTGYEAAVRKAEAGSSVKLKAMRGTTGGEYQELEFQMTAGSR